MKAQQQNWWDIVIEQRGVTVWPSGNWQWQRLHEPSHFTMKSINTEMTDMGMLSWYVTSHSGQLSLLPSVGGEMSSGQRVLFGSQGKSGVTLAMITDSVVQPLAGSTSHTLSFCNKTKSHQTTKLLRFWGFMAHISGKPGKATRRFTEGSN